MALQKNIKLTDNFGIEVEIPNVYIRIQNVDCSKNNTTYSISFNKESISSPLSDKHRKRYLARSSWVCG